MGLLEVGGIVMRFGGVVALDGPSFAVEEGRICGLIGPNGAGKTTLFNCISRLYTPQEGSIAFAGEDLLGCRAHDIAGLGIAPATGRQFPDAAAEHQRGREDGAGLDDDVEEVRALAEPVLGDQQVAGAGDRQELGQAFEDAEQQRGEQVGHRGRGQRGGGKE